MSHELSMALSKDLQLKGLTFHFRFASGEYDVAALPRRLCPRIGSGFLMWRLQGTLDASRGCHERTGVTGG